jgi:tetratricopeptide repeat protein
MSNCSASAETAERYVSGGLSEPDQAAFEEHFFECDRCLAAVQALQSAQAALAAAPTAAAHVAAAPAAPKRFAVPYRWLAAAAMLVLSVVLLRAPWATEPGSTPPAAPTTPANPTVAAPAPSNAVPSSTTNGAADLNMRLTRMSTVTPPPYVSLTTRAQEDADARAFEDAMADYTAARYDAAARGLAAIAARSPRSAHVLFFLGVSQLMAEDVDGARESLARTVRAKAPPYSDEAHFYLAKAALRARDLGAARSALEAAVKRGAGPDGEAARLLEEVVALQR